MIHKEFRIDRLSGEMERGPGIDGNSFLQKVKNNLLSFLGDGIQTTEWCPSKGK